MEQATAVGGDVLVVAGVVWTAQVYAVSPPGRTAQNVPADLINRLLLVACWPP